jgi:hypothetical protein
MGDLVVLLVMSMAVGDLSLPGNGWDGRLIIDGRLRIHSFGWLYR